MHYLWYAFSFFGVLLPSIVTVGQTDTTRSNSVPDLSENLNKSEIAVPEKLAVYISPQIYWHGSNRDLAISDPNFSLDLHARYHFAKSWALELGYRHAFIGSETFSLETQNPNSKGNQVALNRSGQLFHSSIFYLLNIGKRSECSLGLGTGAWRYKSERTFTLRDSTSTQTATQTALPIIITANYEYTLPTRWIFGAGISYYYASSQVIKERIDGGETRVRELQRKISVSNVHLLLRIGYILFSR